MNLNHYPSKLLEQAVNEFSRFPGVGSKTALRFVLHLIKQDEEDIDRFGNIILQLKNSIKYCSICYNITDTEICEICSKPERIKSSVCVVENIKDVIAIENTRIFNGLYHVMGGIISPIDGIGPDDITIKQLEQRVAAGDIKEIILALSTTIEGDTTNFYIYKKLEKYNVPVSTLARGVSVGNELEYIDEITLGRSIVNRVSYDPTNLKKTFK